MSSLNWDLEALEETIESFEEIQSAINYKQAQQSLQNLVNQVDLTTKEQEGLEDEINHLSFMLEKLEQSRLQIIAFGLVGRGKSSVLNALIGEEIFQTGPLHGVTKTIEQKDWCLDHHFLSDLNNPLKDHELRSIHILKYIKNKYNLRLTEEDINEITRMIMPSIDDGFKYQIVCNEKNGYDTDKLDYLNRDCHHLGLPYKYDYTRILKQIKVIDNQICFPIKQLSNVYELFELRYKLHQQVYQHPVISCAEMMILDIFKLSHLNDEKEEYISDPEKFRRLSDDYINHIYYTTDNINLKDIYERFKSRRMYKFYGDFEEDTDISIPYKYKLKIKINFGKGDKNPLEFINFYEDNKIIKIDLNKHMILIPNKYEINKFRYIY